MNSAYSCTDPDHNAFTEKLFRKETCMTIEKFETVVAPTPVWVWVAFAVFVVCVAL
jgi:hypothetical protein